MNEREMLQYLSDAVNGKLSLRDFSYDIGEELLDPTSLEAENPALADYLLDVMPEYAETYHNDEEFLPGLKQIYQHAKTLTN